MSVDVELEPLGAFVGFAWSRLGRCGAIAVLALIGFGGLGTVDEARAARYSSIVIDAQTGDVLSEYNADSPNYPASLTKMMTLYLTFDALEHNKITLDQRFLVSAHAAAQEPTKLNLIAGDTVAVHDLILGLVTQSANDAAVVLAEGLAGGSEHAFAQKMTQTALAMGMEHTNFDNASGLPDPLNHTTARDLAMLARHLYLDFPREYAYFSTEEFKYHGVTYTNHNHLMASFQGMDGIKTGFIRASGFNLAASAVRNNRRLIGIVMGGVSAHARDLKMAALLNAAFDGTSLPENQLLAGREDGKVVATADTTLHTIAHHAARTLAHLSPISRAEAATPAHHAVDVWSIQVGAYHQERAAAHASAQAFAHVSYGKPVAVAASAGKHRTYQARIVNLTEKQAQSACRTLRRDHRACMVIAPSSMQMAAVHNVKNLAD